MFGSIRGFTVARVEGVCGGMVENDTVEIDGADLEDWCTMQISLISAFGPR
jgi:hypothetical protein